MTTAWPSDSRPCPSSLTETEYKPKFFNEPEYLNLDKENIPPTGSVTPHSLKNLSLEEGNNNNGNKATSWEASVARNIVTTPRACSPYLKWTSMLEDLEPNTDDDIIDITDILERLANDKWSPQYKHKCHDPTHWLKDTAPHLKTAPHIYPWMQQQQHLPNCTRTEIWGILPDKKRIPHADGLRVWENCHPGLHLKITTFIWLMMKKVTHMKNQKKGTPD